MVCTLPLHSFCIYNPQAALLTAVSTNNSHVVTIHAKFTEIGINKY